MTSQRKWMIGALVFLAGCSTAAPKKDTDESEAKLSEIRALTTALTSRIEAIETKVGALNDKVDLTRLSVTPSSGTQLVSSTGAGAPSTGSVKATNLPSQAVHPHPGEGVGGHLKTPVSPNDPDAGFVNDDAVQNYRKAMVLFQFQKYSDSILAFSNFLEQFPDHPLAGSAQFYVGESYFKQKEYKLALQEYQRVLTSYDRSSHTSQTLQRMAESEDILKKPEAAAKHRQLLNSLFPQSPAASTQSIAATNTSEPTPSGLNHQELDGPPPTAPLSAVEPKNESKVNKTE